MNKIIYAFAAAMVMCLAMTVYSKGVAEDLKSNVVRLHIIANSDSEEDQAVKLKVRDAVLENVRKTGKSDDLAAVKSIADEVLKENGFTYAAEVKTGLFYFPEKSYKDTVFPCGEYNAVRIVLGSGEGQNWWCVMYPPLCFDESVDGAMSDGGLEQLKEALDDETYELVTEKPKIKFKIVEAINNLISN
ncbi:MAG: stage II sporulation protein R [Firmicutes bacterium]|nr:stage II sporulation protein R [Bacillota bacterium]